MKWLSKNNATFFFAYPFSKVIQLNIDYNTDKKLMIITMYFQILPILPSKKEVTFTFFFFFCLLRELLNILVRLYFRSGSNNCKEYFSTKESFLFSPRLTLKLETFEANLRLSPNQLSNKVFCLFIYFSLLPHKKWQNNYRIGSYSYR